MTVSFDGSPYIGLILGLVVLAAFLLAAALAPSRRIWPLCPPHDLGPMENTLMGSGQRCSKWREDNETAIRLLSEAREERLRRLLERER